MNKVNTETLNLIKEFEGLVLSAYPDPATNGEPWTIGYGHTSAAGSPKVVKGMKITKTQAEQMLVQDLKKYEAAVQKGVKVNINDNQYGALVSFCYNLGPGNFQKSTLLKKVNSRDFIGASKEFAKWNKAAGKIMNGLTRRREAERVLFLKPVQAIPSIPVVVVPEVPKPSVQPSVAPTKSILEWFFSLFRKDK